MPDYTNLGFDQYGNAANSPVSKNQPPILGFNFDLTYEMQGKKAKLSQVGIGSVIELSPAGSVLGTFGNNTSFTITTTVSPNAPNLDRRLFAMPFVSVYAVGTDTGSMQIYPTYGAGIANSKYVISSGFDYRTTNGTNEVFDINIENNSGATGTFYAISQWRNFRYNYGTGS